VLRGRFADEKRRIESHTREITPRGSLADFEQTTISIFNAAAPSVVYIFTEKYAQNIIDAISDYFLTQRIKPDQKNDTERLVKHHTVIVAAMKTKQHVDEKYVNQLKISIEGLIPYYSMK